MALALAPGLAGLTPALATCVTGRHDLVPGQDGRGSQWEGRPCAFGDLLVDLTAERGAVQCAEPGLLAEHVLGLGPGQDVALNFADPVLEFGEGAGLGQDGGGNRTGRGGGDDVGGDPFDADEILEHAHLEGAFGATTGEDERGGTRAGFIQH